MDQIQKKKNLNALVIFTLLPSAPYGYGSHTCTLLQLKQAMDQNLNQVIQKGKRNILISTTGL